MHVRQTVYLCMPGGYARWLLLGAAITTGKNVVDGVVTEYGVAELRGSSIRERTRKLIGIAHPKFRAELERKAREMDFL